MLLIWRACNRVPSSHCLMQALKAARARGDVRVVIVQAADRPVMIGLAADSGVKAGRSSCFSLTGTSGFTAHD